MKTQRERIHEHKTDERYALSGPRFSKGEIPLAVPKTVGTRNRAFLHRSHTAIGGIVIETEERKERLPPALPVVEGNYFWKIS